MIKKIFLIVAFMLSAFLFIFQYYKTIKKHSESAKNTPLSVINQKIVFPSSTKYSPLLVENKLNFNFKAKYNNLGTVEVLFDTNKRINTDWLLFRIKESDSSSWYYENKYKTDQFRNEVYFPFGFPIIEKSQNKYYSIEIESISGSQENSVSLNKNTDGFLAKYLYSKQYLSKNKPEIFIFVINKLKEYSAYPSNNHKNFIFLSSLMPLLAWLILFNRIKFKDNPRLIKTIEAFFPIIIFSVAFIVSGIFSTIGTDPHHDGILIKPALDLTNGKMLFRDTFTQYGALTTLLQSFSLVVFGKYLITIKLLTAFFYGLILTLLYYIWIRLMSKKLAFFSALILLLLAPFYIFTFLPWSSVYALFFQCLTVYFLLRHLETENSRWLFYSGISTALVFWSKQNVGAFVLAPTLIFLIIVKFIDKKKFKLLKNIVQYIVGGLITSLIFITWINVNSALSDWWKQSIVLAAGFIEAKSETNLISSLLPAYVHPSYIGFFSIWIILPVAALITFIKSIHDRKPDKKTIVITLFCLFSWLQYYPITDIRHVFWAAAPMTGILIAMIYNISTSITKYRKNSKYILFIFLFWLIFYPDINYRMTQGFKKITANYYFTDKPEILRGMKLTKEEYVFYKDTFKTITDYKKIYGDVNLVTNSPNALYTTFTFSENFHPQYADFGSTIYPDYYLIKNDYIEKNKPLIMSIWNQIHPGYCRISKLTNSMDTAFLIAPCENVDQSE